MPCTAYLRQDQSAQRSLRFQNCAVARALESQLPDGKLCGLSFRRCVQVVGRIIGNVIKE